MNDAVAWILIAFLCGSLPLAYWLGKFALGVDIRQFGDGNPGSANVWWAGGKWWGSLAAQLDFLVLHRAARPNILSRVSC